MNRNYAFKYNQAIVNAYANRVKLLLTLVNSVTTNDGIKAVTELHIKCVTWLADNLEIDKDYEYSNSIPDALMIVAEYIWFENEEDLLAFRLACGI